MGPSDPRETVVLLHGIWRTENSMRRLERAFRDEGYSVLNETYSSHTESIPEIAEDLWKTVNSLDTEKVHFVAHSMGGLVVRQMLASHEMTNLGRVVMIAPPSRGAALADHYGRLRLFGAVMGPAGLQLHSGDESYVAQLPPPPCEFAIIAGSRGDPEGWNPRIPGDDDGTVGVSESLLPGVDVFRTVHARHTFIMNRPEVVTMSLAYVKGEELPPNGSGAQIEESPE